MPGLPVASTAPRVSTDGEAAAPSADSSADGPHINRLRRPPGNPAGDDLTLLALESLQLAYRAGDDWSDMFDRLTAAEVDRLKDLFPYMPAPAARHFAERFIIPAR